MKPAAQTDSEADKPPENATAGKRLIVLGLGGTIASTSSSRVESSTYALTESLSSLFDTVPEARSLAKIETRQLASVASQEIGSAELLLLAAEINAALAEGCYDGVVVTHGTDTLEETAYFLQLTVKSAKPVVLTGAMRPASALSSDGPLNLFDAVRVAASPEAVGRGVMVVASGRIFAARAASKLHTHALDAFRAPEEGALGLVVGTSLRFFDGPLSSAAKILYEVEGLTALPPVDVIYGHQELRPVLFEAAIASGAKGLVFAATGNGTVSQAARHGAQLARERGVAFVRASRVGGGCVTLKAVDRDLGTVAAGPLNPQKARIFLRLALTRTSLWEELQELFDKA